MITMDCLSCLSCEELMDQLLKDIVKQDTLLTLAMTCIETCCIVIQTGLIFWTIIIARREINKWRKEAIGNKHIDLVIELADTAVTLRTKIEDFRRLFVGVDSASKQEALALGGPLASLIEEEAKKLTWLMTKTKMLLNKDFDKEIFEIQAKINLLAGVVKKWGRDDKLNKEEYDILCGKVDGEFSIALDTIIERLILFTQTFMKEP